MEQQAAEEQRATGNFWRATKQGQDTIHMESGSRSGCTRAGEEFASAERTAAAARAFPIRSLTLATSQPHTNLSMRGTCSPYAQPAGGLLGYGPAHQTDILFFNKVNEGNKK